MDTNDPNIPIVGQPVQLILWYPTAILGCKCKGDNHVSIIVVTGLNNHVKCGNCEKLYHIESIMPNGSINVGFVLPTPKGSVM